MRSDLGRLLQEDSGLDSDVGWRLAREARSTFNSISAVSSLFIVGQMIDLDFDTDLRYYYESVHIG